MKMPLIYELRFKKRSDKNKLAEKDAPTLISMTTEGDD